MRKSALPLVICLTALCCLAFSCGRHYCAPPSDSVKQPPAISKTAGVDVFLDATLSMKGFIVPGIASRYQQTLPLLESVVTRGWSTGEVKFFRFGTIIEELKGREYLAAQKPQFYMDNRIFKET